MCELTLLVHVVGTESTLPPICGCVLVVAGTGERALLRFNTHTHIVSKIGETELQSLRIELLS